MFNGLLPNTRLQIHANPDQPDFHHSGCRNAAWKTDTEGTRRIPDFFWLPSMTYDLGPEPAIDHGVPGMPRRDKTESPVQRSPVTLVSPPLAFKKTETG